MSTYGNCVKRDVCIYAKEDICNDCGHYISDRKFTFTNSAMDAILALAKEYSAQEALSDKTAAVLLRFAVWAREQHQ